MPKHTFRARVVAGLAVAFLSVAGCGVKSTSGGGSDSGDYPTGPVEMPVGASAGGSSDLVSRAVSQGLSDSLGGSFPVINKEGANGALAANEVKSAKNDGSTISIQNASLFAITPLAVSADEKTDIDDFDVVYGVSRDDYVMVTNAKSGYQKIEDLKAAGKKISYATTGVGTGSQLATALVFQSADIPGTSVPFDGGAPALTALLGNQVDVATLQVGEAIENIQSGKLTPLSVFSQKRVKYLPDVPTAKEQGFDVDVAQYRFMTTPKGTPEAVKDKIVDGLKQTYQSAAYKKFNEANSLTPMEIPGDEVLAQLKEDQKRYAALVEQYGISLGES
jgi:tripartite-type tricarboxylate transporter receptor subunit TctC